MGTEIEVKKEIWKRIDKSEYLWAEGKKTYPLRIVPDEPFIIENQSVKMIRGGVYNIKIFAELCGVTKEKKEK